MNVLLEVAYALEVASEWHHCLEARKQDLGLETAKSTVLAHLRLDLEHSLEKWNIGLGTHTHTLSHGKPHFSKPQAVK